MPALCESWWILHPNHRLMTTRKLSVEYHHHDIRLWRAGQAGPCRHSAGGPRICHSIWPFTPPTSIWTGAEIFIYASTVYSLTWANDTAMQNCYVKQVLKTKLASYSFFFFFVIVPFFVVVYIVIWGRTFEFDIIIIFILYKCWVGVFFLYQS